MGLSCKKALRGAKGAMRRPNYSLSKVWTSCDTAASILSYFKPREICALSRLSRHTETCCQQLLSKVKQVVFSKSGDAETLRLDAQMALKRCPSMEVALFDETFGKENQDAVPILNELRQILTGIDSLPAASLAAMTEPFPKLETLCARTTVSDLTFIRKNVEAQAAQCEQESEGDTSAEKSKGMWPTHKLRELVISITDTSHSAVELSRILERSQNHLMKLVIANYLYFPVEDCVTEISNLKNLQTLGMVCVRLRDMHMAVLGHCPQLRVFSLGLNSLVTHRGLLEFGRHSKIELLGMFENEVDGTQLARGLRSPHVFQHLRKVVLREPDWEGNFARIVKKIRPKLLCFSHGSEEHQRAATLSLIWGT